MRRWCFGALAPLALAGGAAAQDLAFPIGEGPFTWESYQEFADAHDFTGQRLVISGAGTGNDATRQEIAASGGGILATTRATRAASEDELVAQSRPRLDALMAEGVTTVEIKSGYGLTLGIHSRIEESVEHIVARLQTGNVYVNRNIIGAVVGTQPFGGHGLSGTGPKAGGPHYLARFTRPQAPEAAPDEVKVSAAEVAKALAAPRRAA